MFSSRVLSVWIEKKGHCHGASARRAPPCWDSPRPWLGLVWPDTLKSCAPVNPVQCGTMSSALDICSDQFYQRLHAGNTSFIFKEQTHCETSSTSHESSGWVRFWDWRVITATFEFILAIHQRVTNKSIFDEGT